VNPQTHTGPRLLRADQLKLAAVVTAPTCARLFVRHVCEQWVILDRQADIAELLASELVTNAVEATGVLGADPEYPVVHALAKPIRIWLLRFEHSLVLGVWDTSLDLPRLLEPDDEAERGRGLQLVDSLSTRWGYCYARVSGKA
jgi:anti-sigma regulatory factor (Ser/Thr protein kinase)